MPEVPPDEQERTPSQPPGEAPPGGAPPRRDPLTPGDVRLTPPPAPFGPERRADREPAGGPLGAGVGQPPPSPDATASTGPPAPPAWQAPANVVTTGVPHYQPPMTVPTAGGAGAAAGAAAPTAAAPPKRRSLVRPFARGARELAETIILALLIFLFVRAVVQNFQVEGRSMEPTFESGWYLLVNKAIYWEINLETIEKFVPFIDPGDDPTRYIFRGPQRGDVVVFRSPTSGTGELERDFIKRIVAMPGETVEVHDCTVFIDGVALDEPYINELPTYQYGPEAVPEGSYFVLGDNRNNSSDSSTWGPLPKENIIGLAWVTYWPFSAFGLVDNQHVDPGDDLPDNPDVKQPAECTAAAEN